MPTPSASVAKKSRMELFARNVWIVEGPVVSFYGFPYPTRMVVIRIPATSTTKTAKTNSKHTAWIWSPVEWSSELGLEIETTVGGPITTIVSPNKIHWLFLQQWQEHYGEAKFYAPPGLKERRICSNVRFEDETLSNIPPQEYAHVIDQVVFQGGILDEVWFFHRPSKTVLVCDLIQRHEEEGEDTDDVHNNNHGSGGGFMSKAWLMKLDGVVGPLGSTPKEWRFCFWVCGLMTKAKATVEETVLQEWNPIGLIIAHGMNEDYNASSIIEACLAWMLQAEHDSITGGRNNYCRPVARQCNCWPQDEDEEPTDEEDRLVLS